MDRRGLSHKVMCEQRSEGNTSRERKTVFFPYTASQEWSIYMASVHSIWGGRRRDAVRLQGKCTVRAGLQLWEVITQGEQGHGTQSILGEWPSFWLQTYNTNVLLHSLGDQGLSWEGNLETECEKGEQESEFASPLVRVLSKWWCTKGDRAGRGSEWEGN